MKYLQEKFSVGDYHPNPEKCCETCIFGTGLHEWWCPVALRVLDLDLIVTKHLIHPSKDT
jgi:hypothetical protein